MKKVFAWMGRHWIITSLLAIFLLTVAVYDEEAVINELSATDPKIAAKLEKAKQEREYLLHKEELDAMNCGKIMAQYNGLTERLRELNSWRQDGWTEHGKRKRAALDEGVTDDAIWAELDGMKKNIEETHAQKKAEIEAEYLPKRALEYAANEKGCFSY